MEKYQVTYIINCVVAAKNEQQAEDLAFEELHNNTLDYINHGNCIGVIIDPNPA